MTTATIAGVVQDASGAVIPGVSVTTRNVDTGITRTVTTDEGGRYTLPDLTVGNYEVEAQLPGFQTEVRSGITLSVGRSAVINFALKVGQLSDKVTITEEAPLVESTTAAMTASAIEVAGKNVWLGGNIGRSLLPELPRIRTGAVSFVRSRARPHCRIVAAGQRDRHGSISRACRRPAA